MPKTLDEILNDFDLPLLRRRTRSGDRTDASELSDMERGFTPIIRKSPNPPDRNVTLSPDHIWAYFPDMKYSRITALERGRWQGRGPRAIVLHRTDSTTGTSTLNAFQTRRLGTHYMIDENGTIHLTADPAMYTKHVGKIRPRNESYTRIPGELYGPYTRRVHDIEAKKDYPDRYPTSEDSIGIEIVGKYDTVRQIFAEPSIAQHNALMELLNYLKLNYGLSDSDIYAHGRISYKDENLTEGTQFGY